VRGREGERERVRAERREGKGREDSKREREVTMVGLFD
jgi:hypothetical protein